MRAGYFAWTPASAVGTRIYGQDIASAWELNSFVREKLDWYTGWRGTIVVEIRHSGTPYQFGQLLACLDPTPHRSETYYGNGSGPLKANPCNSFYKGLQHPFSVKIEPSQTNVALIKLPWMDNWAFRNRGETHQYAFLRVWVLAPLGKVDATTAQNVELTVNVWVEDAEAVVSKLNQSGPPAPDYVPVITNLPACIPRDLVEREVQSGKGFSREGASPVLPRGVTARELLGSAVGYMADRMGLAKPTESSSAPTHRVTTTSSRSRLAGWFNAFQASATGEASIDPSAAALGFGSDSDADIANVANRWGLIAQANFLQTAARGDVVWTGRATPVAYMKIVDDDGVGTLAIPPATFAALHFGAWRGKLKMCVEVVASPYHRGTLRVVHSPVTVSPVAAGDYQTISINKVIEVAGSSCTEFEVPWTSPLPVLPTDALGGSYAIPSLTQFSSWLGYVGIVVESPLTSGNGGATASVQVNIYMKVEDFEGYGPDTQQLCHFVITRANQSGVGFKFDTQKTVFGERVMSFNQLARKLTYGNSLRLCTDGGGAIQSSALIQRIFTRLPSQPCTQPRYGYTNGAANVYVPFDVETYNYNKLSSHLPMLCSAFYAMRGGFRVGFDVGAGALGMKRSLQIGGTGDVVWGDQKFGVVNHLVLWDSGDEKIAGDMGAFIKGAISTGNVTSFDTSIESVPVIEVPYNDFAPFRSAQMWPGTTRAAFNTDYNAVSFYTELLFDPTAATTPTIAQLPRGVVYYGAADDFVLNQFMYCPTLYDNQY